MCLHSKYNQQAPQKPEARKETIMCTTRLLFRSAWLTFLWVLIIATATPTFAGQWTVQSFTFTPVMQYYDANFQGDLIGSGFSTYGITPVGRLSGASGNPNYSQERYRSIVACELPNNGIPDNATIQSATLSVTFTGFPYNVNQTVKLVDIDPGTSWSRSFTALWSDAQAGNTYKGGDSCKCLHTESVFIFESQSTRCSISGWDSG